MPFCRNCGAELEENSSFCSKCGTPIVKQMVDRTKPISPRRSGLSPFAIAGIVLLAAVVIVALIAIPLLLGGFLPFSRVVGSGNLRTEEEIFSDFNAVNIGSGFQVQITRSNSYHITVTADDNLFDRIEVSKMGNILSIGLTPGVSVTSTTLEVDISMPDLRELQFSGGVRGTATGFNLTHDLNAELSGGSALTMEGRANRLTVSASGGSSIVLSNFVVIDADIEFSGGSQGTINLSGRLDANLSGGSKLFYLGDPTLGDITTSGGSTVLEGSS